MELIEPLIFNLINLELPPVFKKCLSLRKGEAMKSTLSQFALPTLVLLTLLNSQVSYAGGVGSGGGGTTTRQATPEQVADAVHIYGGVIATAWLQAKQDHTLNGVDHGAYDSFAKLFGSSTNVFTVLQTTKFELRMSSDCMDADGKPTDGSIHASQPGAICLSAFSMAPKLNQSNYVIETVALIIHETSHLVGLNENEAVDIQTQAVKELSAADLDGLLQTVGALASDASDGLFGPVLNRLERAIKNPSTVRSRDMKKLEEGMGAIADPWTSESFYFVSAKTYRLLDPNYVNEGAVSDFVCYRDSANTQEDQANCRAEFDEGFGNDSRVSARTLLSRIRNSDPKDYRSEYDEVIVDKPEKFADISSGLRKTQSFLLAAHAEIKLLRDFKLQTYAAEKP